MDLSNFQRKAIILIFISILAGSLLLARKEPLKTQIEQKLIQNNIIQKKQDVVLDKKININEADVAQLMKIPGIGSKLANEIIQYKNKNGNFTYMEQLLDIPGLGEKKLNRIKNFIDLPEKNSKDISSSNYKNSGKITISEAPVKIDLNTATAEQLCEIPYIGPKTAQSIIEYRNKNGLFHNLEEIKNIPRIGEKTYNKLKAYLYIKSAATQNPKSNIENNVHKNYTYDSRIDPNIKCPYCGKNMWEPGKRKMQYIRCPYCLKLLETA